MDAGMYGSIIKDMIEVYNFPIVGVLYLFSKNPYIYGFLNEKWGIDASKFSNFSISENELSKFHEGSLDEETKKYIIANIIVDSLECLHPHPIKTPKEISVDGEEVNVVIEKQSNGVVQEILEYAWEKVIEGYFLSKPEVLPFEYFENLIIQAKLEFTGLLHTTTPEWSKKPTFLRNWKIGYIPPLGDS
ncbi:MAG TPA: hypothetical protein ENG45_01965 [Candidatus Aenigmarchaeota archaeon]|nr:hypothetical protein [Candidatus Aenigmarchaeota archaeon]